MTYHQASSTSQLWEGCDERNQTVMVALFRLKEVIGKLGLLEWECLD